jgi:ACT domain-containing protein
MRCTYKVKVLTKFLLLFFLSLTSCLDTDGEIEGTAENGSADEIELRPEDILPGVLNPGVFIGEVTQLPTPLDGTGCNTNDILEWNGADWICVPSPSVATMIPASGVQPGTFQAGVLLPANQLTGSIDPSTQIGAGAINASTTLTTAQLRSSCTNNQILQSDGTGNFVCANVPTASVSSVYGRTGAVVALDDDYTSSQINNTAAGNIIATDVQAAINELDTEKLALAGGAMSGAINMSSNVINNLGTPVVGSDATTKSYVDTAVAGAAGAPGGATTQVQFNGTGAFAGDSNFIWDNINKRLGVGTASPAVDFDVNIGTINAAAICDENNANCIDLSMAQTNGTVTSVTTGTGLTGGPITGAGTISIANQGVGTLQLSNDAVTTAQILNGTILNADIANNTIIATDKLTSACTNNQILQSDGAGNFICANLPVAAAAPVDSVYGRTGVVVAMDDDYTSSQINNTAAGNIIATDVQGAINELDTEKLALAGGTMSGAVNMGSNLISNLATPVAGTDATTKSYVDTAIAGTSSGTVTSVATGSGLTG